MGTKAKYWHYASFWQLSAIERIRKALGSCFFVVADGFTSLGHPVWNKVPIGKALEILHNGGRICLARMEKDKIRLVQNGSGTVFEEREDKWSSIGLQIERSVITSSYGGVQFCHVTPELYNEFCESHSNLQSDGTREIQGGGHGPQR